MYYQNYEDYMRSVLGYPIEPNNTYVAYSNSYETMQMPYTNTIRYSDEILELYPEIYRIVNPMVCKICEANTKPITRELVDQMTDEIYMNLEVQPENDTIVNVRANISASKTEESEESRSFSDTNSNSVSKTTNRNSTSNTINSSSRILKDKQNKEIKETTETRDLEKESRQRRPNNRTLRDLIRILILNRLLGGNFPHRPPHHPPRPPMPHRPPVRPPFPREDRFYENYLR